MCAAISESAPVSGMCTRSPSDKRCIPFVMGLIDVRSFMLAIT